MNQINYQDTIYNIIKKHPEAQETLVNLGFKPMANNATVNTVGRVTTLATAIQHLSLSAESVQEAFSAIGVEVVK